MPRMTEKETLFWKDRLEFSHQVWREAGLSEDSGKEGALTWTNAYRAITWADDWGGIPFEHLLEVPTAFWIVNTTRAQLYARHPIIDVHADRPGSKQNARRMEVLQNHLIRSRQLGYKRELNASLLGGLSLHAGVVRHGFTPKEEFYDDKGNQLETFASARPDLPWIKNVPLWDFRCDPQATSFHPKADVRWCAFRSLPTMDQFERTPNLIKREDLRATRNRDLRFSRPFDPQATAQPPEDDNTLVEVWTVYDFEERKWFALSEGSRQTVREPQDWPLAWSQLPYNWLGFYEQMDTPFPIPMISQVGPLIVERNKVRTLMAELVKRTRRVLAINEDDVNPDDLKKLLAGDTNLMEWIRTKGDGPLIQEIRMGGLDQTLLLYDQRIEEDIRQTFGQSLLDRGQRVNVETATEAGAISAGASTQAGLLQGTWEDFVGDVFSVFGSAIQTPGLLTDKLSIPVLGAQDAEALLKGLAGQEPTSEFQEFGAEDVKGSFVYEVRPGSMRPRDPNEEQRKALQSLEVAAKFGGTNLNIPQLLIQYLEAVDQDPAKVFMSPQQQQATAQAAAPAVAAQQNGSKPAPQQPSLPPQILPGQGR